MSGASVSTYRVLYSKDAGKKRMVYNDGFLVVNRKLQGNSHTVTLCLLDEDRKELRRIVQHNAQGQPISVGQEVNIFQFSVQVEECTDSTPANDLGSKAEGSSNIEAKGAVELSLSSSSSAAAGKLLSGKPVLLNTSSTVKQNQFKPFQPIRPKIETMNQSQLNAINTSQSVKSEANDVNYLSKKRPLEPLESKQPETASSIQSPGYNTNIQKENLSLPNIPNIPHIKQETSEEDEVMPQPPPVSYVGVGFTKLVAKPTKFKCPVPNTSISSDIGTVKNARDPTRILLDVSIMRVMKEHQIAGANFLLDKTARKCVLSGTVGSKKEIGNEILGKASHISEDELVDTDEEDDYLNFNRKTKKLRSAGEEEMVENVPEQPSASSSIRGCILADEMGLGKTLTTLSVLYSLMQHDVCKSIIVTPSSLVDNWANETKKWFHTKMNPLVIKAGSDANAIINTFAISRISRYPILIISYELFRKHVDMINHAVSGVDMIVCDEGHRLKNVEGSKTMDALSRCKATMRIVLTGTPIQNDIEELYALVSFVAPTLLGSLQNFKQLYTEHVLQKNEEERSEESRAIVTLLSSIILRRTQSEVLTKLLPPRTDFVIKCFLSSFQSQIYDQIVEESKRQLDGGDNVVDDVDIYATNILDSSNSSSCVLPALQTLRKICVLPQLEEKKILTSKATSGAISTKLQIVESLIHNIRKQCPTDKIVLVSSQMAVLDAMEEQVINRRGWGPVHRLDGSVAVDLRQRMVDQFNQAPPSASKSSKFKSILPSSSSSNSNDKKDCFIFLLSTKAGGVGINLIGANRLIMLDIEWNPAIDKQAMSRVWRQGQKKPVYVYRLIAEGTIEASMLDRQVKKASFESLLDTDKTLAQTQSEDTTSFSRGKLTSSDFHKLVYPNNMSLIAMGNNNVEDGGTIPTWNETLQIEEEEIPDMALKGVTEDFDTKTISSIHYSSFSMVSVDETDNTN